MASSVWRATAAAALVLLAAGAAPGQDDAQARELMRAVLEAMPKQSFVAKMTVTSEAFAPRELRLSRKFVDGAHGSYLEVVAPDDLEGIRFLFLERADKPNEQYIKVKASRSAVRVSDDIRQQPFLGSAFYVSDLVMPELDDYTYRYLGKDVLDGRTVTLVEMTPKRPDQGVYSRSIVALDPKDKLVLRREFFDPKGDKIKVWTVDKIDQIDGIWTLSGQQMKNLKDQTASRLDISEIAYNVELPDAMFTPKYLLR
ncbi:MAG: outer membrane lipoprotein-sorting protein [Candidatus Binatia bacterium]